MKRLIGSSEFSKNVLTLVSGTGLAQLITLAASPVLSRLFLPEEFAPYTLFVAIIGIVSVIAAGRFELAILLPKKEVDAKNLIALAIIISFITSVFTLFGILIYDFWLYQYWPSGKFNAWFYLLAPTIFIMGVYKTMNYWSTRNKTFKINALGRVLMSFIIALLSIIFGLFDFVPGLIIAYFFGNLIGLIGLSGDLIKEKFRFFTGVNKSKIRSVFVEHSDFAKVNVPHALVDNFQEYGIIFFIAYFFSEALVGLYGFSFRILKAPLALIGSALYQVFYQKVTDQQYPANEVKRMVKEVYRKTFIIGIVPFVVIFLFAPNIFAFVFGEAWREAGVIAQLLTPWLLLNFMVSPVSCIPLLYKRQKGAFTLTIVDVIFKYSILIVAGLFDNYHLGFLLLGIFGSGLMLFAMWWYIYIIEDEK